MSFLFNGCSGLGADLVHVQDNSAQQKTNITGLSAERVTSGLAVKVEGSLYRELRGDATVADRLSVSYGMLGRDSVAIATDLTEQNRKN